MTGEFVLVTGASGYIGSHVVFALLEAGINVLAMENSTSTESGSLKKLQETSDKKLQICRCNLLNNEEISSIFKQFPISTVIHLAASKGVSQSMSSPLACYSNNLLSTINLITAMKQYKVFNMIFSSSCAVYGDQSQLPVNETAQSHSPTNVYAKSKKFVEEMLSDIAKADKEFKFIIFRYFNPVGAHESNLIGEDPSKLQVSLLTLMCNVALGRKEKITIFGNCIRDYIHVMDIAEAHTVALKKFQDNFNFKVINLGSSRGTSLLELIQIFENVNNVKIPYEIKEKREGEIEAIVADTNLAENELGWKARRNIESMCRDSDFASQEIHYETNINESDENIDSNLNYNDFQNQQNNIGPLDNFNNGEYEIPKHFSYHKIIDQRITYND
ncbi:hypothetical protein PVAND_013136 [Polypedilum vanderplanki]|uniref:UDP-N-acetylglucosamine 4-epimerase n=1 Tax=Polypedilum vanderplanki TaxID=319348 RepID=A0A9J6CQJ9_POLVA|nr:hypothetical protein PVAND_013136 [Polypedilum vanderplanki]